MNIVHARLWRTKVTIGSDGLAEVVTATEVGRRPLPVSLSQLVGINALACDLRGVIDEGVHDHEVNLLTSYVADTKNGTPLTAHYPRLTATSRHIRSFVSECTGLGVMSAVSETLFAWKPDKRSLNSFDVLPRQLIGVYGRKGPRPDLLFHLDAGVIAGEARGRSRKEKSLFPTTATKPQKDRILTLANWSIRNTGHPYFMSWVWIGPSGVVVDVFLPDDEKVTNNIATDWVKTTNGERWVIAPERSRHRPVIGPATDFSEDGTMEGGDNRVARRRTIRVQSGTVRRVLEESANQADIQADAVMRKLFERRPIVGSVAGIPVRGKWITANALGPATHEVLVGVLGEGLPTEGRAQRRRRSLGVDAALDGRLLTVVHHLDEERPSWDRIERDILRAP
ncbi:predicted protein [Streptomyces viridochromogenes DSM 40736]|uniref:Predicted protein n=1 Tax=Streptomyces viridochromogenes (strain DSM 40736 / JCM 4977 / BCRC 1201 / Tue 494) TaxID=591159 RepID=D9XFX3_STRVT|nr:hypothetical protein [Streptomyces viridochromogenes]EFL34854.1 predicted protein [Streptomyces viridochromogenes DSM 40736]